MSYQFLEESHKLASEILKIAQRAHTEEDLRIGVEKLLEPALKKLEIKSEIHF